MRVPPPPPTDFAFVPSPNERGMLLNAYNAISYCELWNWMSSYEPSGGYGFCTEPEISRLSAEMCKEHWGQMHSGCSFGWTMRQMQFIAKHSLEEFRIRYLETINSSTPP
jgi:hypothetical protein